MVGATNSNCRLGSDCAHSFYVVFRHCDYIVDIQNIHAKFPGSCLSLHSAKDGKRKMAKKMGAGECHLGSVLQGCCSFCVFPLRLPTTGNDGISGNFLIQMITPLRTDQLVGFGIAVYSFIAFACAFPAHFCVFLSAHAFSTPFTPRVMVFFED